MAIPLEGAKAAKRAGNALTGDIYVRRWQSVKGMGKNKRTVEHELRVNPVSIGLGAIAAGVTAVGLGAAMWLTQKKLGKADAKRSMRIVRYYEPIYETVIVKDYEYYMVVRGVWVLITKEYYDEIKDSGATVKAVEIGEHPEIRLITDWFAIVYSKNGIPVTFTDAEGKRVIKLPGKPDIETPFYLTPLEKGKGWEYDTTREGVKFSTGLDRYGKFQQYTFPIYNKNKKPLALDNRTGMFEGWF